MTNVPSVYFGPNGFVAPTDAAILAGAQADINAAFGGGLNPGLATPQGQLATSLSAIVSQSDQTFLYQSTQTDPAYAEGRWQDAICRIYFITRNSSQPTIINVACSGLSQVAIPIGALVTDASGNVYSCTTAGVIPPTGSVTLPFANLAVGPIAIPTANGISIYQAIPGWDSVSVVSGELGQDVETRAELEARRAASVAGNSAGMLTSLRGALLGVTGVTDAYVTENDNSTPITVGGVALSPNSVYVAVVGGLSSAVAQAIWTKKPPGCAMNGNTTVTVYDTNYTPPYPSYQITYEVPFNLAILYAVSIKNGPNVPANALTLVQNAILGASAAGSAPEENIGSTIYALSYSTAIASLGSWAQLISIQVGSNNSPAALVTGRIAGTTFTVTGVTSGSLAAGQTLTSGSGVSGSGGASGSSISVGTTIVVQLAGTTGGVGTYSVSNTQTLGSGLVTAAVANTSQVSVQINQQPTIAAPNVSLTLV